MQRTLLPIVAGCVAAVFFAVPKPASATTAAAPAVHYGETNAGMVQQVGRRYWRGRRELGPMPKATAIGPIIGPMATIDPMVYWGRPGINFRVRLLIPTVPVPLARVGAATRDRAAQ